MQTRLEAGVLFAELGGKVSLDSANRLSLDLFQAIANHRAERVIVDCRSLDTNLAPMEIYEHALFMAKAYPEFNSKGAPLATRLAYVVSEFIEEDAIGFGETAAMNRGLFLQVFETLEEARKWLESE